MNARKLSVTAALADQLSAYQTRRPAAVIDAYRQPDVGVRVRVIDPAFGGVDVFERYRTFAAEVLERVEDFGGDGLFQVLLLTPEEAEGSERSREFDEPELLDPVDGRAVASA